MVGEGKFFGGPGRERALGGALQGTTQVGTGWEEVDFFTAYISLRTEYWLQLAVFCTRAS